MSSTAVRVRVPATTANLGPGFDALGLAVGIYNVVTAEPASILSVRIEGEGETTLPRDEHNVVVRAIARVFQAMGCPAPPLRLHCVHAIPPARGLGSSAAAVVAGLMVGDALSGGALGPNGVLALATEIEGHPDNAAPAVFGGLQSSVLSSEGKVYRATVPSNALPYVALFIPDFPMPTREARAVLPASLSRTDAVFNVSRAALLVAAIASGRDDLLAVATEDALHQRPREAIFPAMPTLIKAARDAGALGAWLSGAGSTVAAFARAEHAASVAESMARKAGELGIAGRALAVPADIHGAQCETA